MEQPTKIQPFSRTLIVVLGILVAVILIIILGVIPQLNRLKENNIEVAVLKSELKKKEEKLENLKTLAQAIEGQREKTEKIIQALPKGPNTEELLVQLNNIAKTAGVDFQTFAPSEFVEEEVEIAESEPTLKTLSFEITIQGKYSQITKFVKELANNIRPINTTSWEMTATEESNNPTILAHFSLVTYYQ